MLRDDLFAGTPDTFFIKYLLAKAASCKDFGLLVVDISVAFMHTRTDEEMYVEVPSGIKSSRFWRQAAVNGTRKASKHWQELSCDKLVTKMLFQQNDISLCIYKRLSDNLDLEQHGDDFLVCGSTSTLEVLADEFKKHFLLKKAEIVSLKPEHQNEIHFLKRRIRVDNFGWHVELDQRCVKSLLDATAMDHCTSMATPGSKGQESSRNVADSTEKLGPQEHREFRPVSGICQYMTEQRFDIAFSTKKIMREAAGPTTASETKLKRIARYLKGRQRCVLNFPWVGKLDDVIHVTVDADWAGDPKTRCSTSGGVLAIDPCFTVRHWSVTQATVSLSAAESEVKAITKGCIEALYVKHLLEHQTARPFKIELWTDSSSAKALMQRHGTRAQSETLGRADDVGSTVEQDRSHLAHKLGTLENVTDLLTKQVPRAVLDKLAGMMAHTIPDEETQKFKSTRVSRRIIGIRSWQQLRDCRCSTMRENESLEDDVHSFEDKTTNLTTFV